MEYHPAMAENEILPFAATWMDLEGIILNAISQRQILYDITYMRNRKKYNKLVNVTKKQQTHRYREQTRGYQWCEGGKEGKYGDRELRSTIYYV